MKTKIVLHCDDGIFTFCAYAKDGSRLWTQNGPGCVLDPWGERDTRDDGSLWVDHLADDARDDWHHAVATWIAEMIS